MHHNCTARHIKRARLARGSLDSADFAISFVCEERYPVTIAVGRHLFPSRTQQLSPPAPMVLPWQRGGRVGRCRVSLFSSGALFRPEGPVTRMDDLPPFELGYPGTELRQTLVAAVLDGRKTAT